VHIGLQMCEGKFVSIKYMQSYIYANFGHFLAPPGIWYLMQLFIVLCYTSFKRVLTFIVM